MWFWAANILCAATALGALAAIGVPALQPRIFNKDYLAGLLFQGFGVATLWVGAELALGTAVRMGPGYVPRMLAFILVGLGAVVSFKAIMVPDEAPDKGSWRPFVLVNFSVVVFAYVYDFAGLVPAIIATLLVASLGSTDQRWGQTMISVGFLIALCIGVFRYALGLPMPLFELRM